VAVIDLGAGGALVESTARLLPGRPVVLQLLRAGEARVLPARVLRCEVCALSAGAIRYRGALRFDEG
jgi:hypothetical protein